jgi:hypothetical protein
MGDGKTKVRPTAPGQQNAFTSEGFTLPKMKLGEVKGKIKIDKGIACIETFESKSADGELYLEGGLRFEDPFKRSQSQLYARFTWTDELKKREAVTGDMYNMIKGAALRSDGFLGYSARGAVGQMKWLPAKATPAGMRECGGSTTTAANDKRAKASPRGKPPVREPATPPRGPAVNVTPTPPPVTPTPPPGPTPPVDEPPPPDNEPPPSIVPPTPDAAPAAPPPDPDPPPDDVQPIVEPQHDTDPDQPRGHEDQPPMPEP